MCVQIVWLIHMTIAVLLFSVPCTQNDMYTWYHRQILHSKLAKTQAAS